MATILGGTRWEEPSYPDYEPDEELSPLDDDYVREEYETEED